jgi:hypothetical protein
MSEYVPALPAALALPEESNQPMQARYSAIALPDELAVWAKIFRQYDRDGSGDVDLREVGIMLRQLGQIPTQAQMQLFVEEVDINQSGTVDFEEFCLLMQRQNRLALCPPWLYNMLRPPRFDYEAASSRTEGPLPTIATLHDSKFDAAQRIRSTVRRKVSVNLLPGALVAEVEPGQQPIVRRASFAFAAGANALRPVEATSFFTREMLLLVADLLPSAEHIKIAECSGHGAAFGPFVCQELMWRLATSTYTTLEHLEMAQNALGDDGAIAVARGVNQVATLLTVDLSGNGIGARGATAIYEALCNKSDESRLRTIKVDDNPSIPKELLQKIHVQLLINTLPDVINAARDAPALPEIGLADEDDKSDQHSAGSHPLEQYLEGMPLLSWPLVALKEPLLSNAHVVTLRTLLCAATPERPAVKALHLDSCVKLSDQGLAALLATPKNNGPKPSESSSFRIMNRRRSSLTALPTHTFLHSLQWLRVSSCDFADLGVVALCEAAEGGHLHALTGLALDRTRMTLSEGLAQRPFEPLSFNDGKIPISTRFGAALRGLVTLEQLDLCHCDLIGDQAAALMCQSLLCPAEEPILEEPEDISGLKPPLRTARSAPRRAGQPAHGSRELPPSMRILHLGGTGAGNRTALEIGECLPTSRLESLCLGNDLGDQGVHALADALPSSKTLCELWIGNKIGDMGLEALCRAMQQSTSPLKLLGLGGTVRGGVTISNRLESRAPRLLAEALRVQPEGINELRLSGERCVTVPPCFTCCSLFVPCTCARPAPMCRQHAYRRRGLCLAHLVTGECRFAT